MTNTRRLFLRSLVRDVLVTYENLHGRPNFPVSEIRHLPLEQVAGMVPCRRSDLELEEREGMLWLVCLRSNTEESVCATASPEARILQRFDGRTALRNIAETIAAETGAEYDEVFRQAHALFIRLAERFLYVPSQ